MKSQQRIWSGKIRNLAVAFISPVIFQSVSPLWMGNFSWMLGTLIHGSTFISRTSSGAFKYLLEHIPTLSKFIIATAGGAISERNPEGGTGDFIGARRIIQKFAPLFGAKGFPARFAVCVPEGRTISHFRPFHGRCSNTRNHNPIINQYYNPIASL